MIITIGNTKGGVGKTTLALNLAIARALAGKEVWLIDGDRQGTAQTALTIRTEANRTPVIACAQYAEGSTLRGQLMKMAPKFDDVVIDAGGRDSTALRAALVLSDLLIVPFAPRSLDVWALSDICTLIDDARSVRDGLKAVAVLNNADPNGQDNADAIAALADFPQLEYLPTPIRRRKPVANAAGQGLSVLEAVPKDSKASEEMNAFVNAVYKLI
jgi:chromosome partitioning protein